MNNAKPLQAGAKPAASVRLGGYPPVKQFTGEALAALVRLSPVLLLYLIYTIVRWLLADRGPEFGPENALRLLRLERLFDLDWELGIQQFGLRHPWIPKTANWYYVAGFIPVLITSSLLAAWRAPQTFLRWRRIFAISLFLALIGFALFPVSPPRLLPADRGYVDTLLAYGPQYYGNARGLSLFNGFGHLPTLVNLYAAMPSMHVAWSSVAGVLLTVVVRRRWVWIVAVLHPLLMAFTVLVTANHFVLDIGAGMLVLGMAIVAEHRLSVRHPAPAPLLSPVPERGGLRTAELGMAYSD